MNMKNILFVVVLMLAFSGCSVSTYYLQNESQTYAETNTNFIKLYVGDIDKDYTVIGSIAADIVGNGDAAAKYLKKEAAKIGADAIIHCRLTKMTSFSQRTGVSGVAVKLNE